jgi:septum formation inhibitor MinC
MLKAPAGWIDNADAIIATIRTDADILRIFSASIAEVRCFHHRPLYEALTNQDARKFRSRAQLGVMAR